MAKTKKEWRAIAANARRTGKMANTLAKALANRYAKRWRFVDFLGPKGRESAGIVDIVAIRKCGKPPTMAGLKTLDLFDIILIQVKGGSAPGPTDNDIKRLRLVGNEYHAENIVLFHWQDKKKTAFQKLDAKGEWRDATAADIFGG